MSACVSWNNNCCLPNRNWNVPMMKCPEGYFIYYLTRTPGASMGYCAGKESPCPKGSNSPTGFTPNCIDAYPLVTGTPVLSVGVNNKQLQFKCTFVSPVMHAKARFEVQFLFGTPLRVAKTISLEGAERVATMDNDHSSQFPMFALGSHFSCRVTTYFDYSPKLRSAEIESNLFYAGIKVESNERKFSLTEKDKPLKLKVTATVPIVCKYVNDCKVSVDVGQINTQSVFDYCTIVFKESMKTQTLEVVAKRDFVDDGDHAMNVAFKVLAHLDPQDWDQHEKIQDVQVMVVDISTATCSSTGDPHITTFDKLYYNHFSVGDFVLVKSTSRKFEVHVRTWKCASVSCNCGIAVREGDDTVIVDMCRGGIPRVVFPSKEEPAPGFKVTRSNNGKSFLITLPSGGFVKFAAYKWFAHWSFANFVIQVPSDDFQSTVGLCGTFDKNSGNDMKDRNGVVHSSNLLARRVAPHAFTESWRLPVGGSMFYYKLGNKNKCNADRVKYYCTCYDDNRGRRVNCNFKGWAMRPKYIQGTTAWKGLTFPGAEHCGKRRRRSTDDNIILPDDAAIGNYVFNEDPNLNYTFPTFPTGSGKTEVGTKLLCKTSLENSDAGKACFRLPGIELQPYLEQCVEDILFSDNTTFVLSSIANLRDDCEELALRNMSLWQPDPAKNGTMGPPIAVGNSLCPNMCSDNGQCENGTCVCKTGFISSDCSLLANQGPTVESIPMQGLCDIRQRECVRTRVVGENFLDSNKLACRTQAVKISEQSYVTTSNVKTTRAFMLSFREAMCEFPVVPLMLNGGPNTIRGTPAAGYLIDISNDGVLFSGNKALFLVYDSKCLACTGAKVGTCVHKSGSCNVNGYCFAKGDQNPDDWCQVCEPATSESKFTLRAVHKAPEFRMARKVSAFARQALRLQLNAFDPDNQTVTFKLGPTQIGSTLSPSGMLVTSLLGKDTTLIEVIAVDKCGMETAHTLEIEPKECPCKNGGQCDMATGSGQVSCLCRQGCTGMECESTLPGMKCKSSSSASGQGAGKQTTMIIILAVALGLVAHVVV